MLNSNVAYGELSLRNRVFDIKRPENLWFSGFNMKPSACLRVFAFPFAGGDSSIFYRWNAWLPKDVELVTIQLPERGSRQAETAVTNMDTLVNALVQALIPLLDKPYAFFGYSMGGLISYAVISRLHQLGLNLPQQLFIAACNPPHLHRHAWHTMSDKMLLSTLIRSDQSWMEGIPRDKLKQNLKLIRKDLQLCQIFAENNQIIQYVIDCPITVFSGEQDTIAPPEDMINWGRYTSRSCISHQLQGGHFFMLDTKYQQLAQLLVREFQNYEQKIEIKRCG